MYASTKATREFALKAAAAAERAMERQACCKSQFKFKCFSCGEFINRGDKITKCTAAQNDGMRLRFRGSDNQNGLKDHEVSFYEGETGTRTWVHIGCNPCFWSACPSDLTPEQCAEHRRLYPNALCGVHTDWGSKMRYEFLEWCDSLPMQQFRSFALFCQTKGYPYPKPKFMKDRIIRAVTRFQALWRGYLYKQAYPVALLQAQAEQMYPPEMQAAVEAEIDSGFAYANKKWLESGEEGENDDDRPDHFGVVGCVRRRRHNVQIRVGEHTEILFNANEPSESLYSGEVIEVKYLGLNQYFELDIEVKVKFHYDCEVRKYTGKKYSLLKREGEWHKKKRGIQATFIGKIATKKKKKKKKQVEKCNLFLQSY